MSQPSSQPAGASAMVDSSSPVALQNPKLSPEEIQEARRIRKAEAKAIKERKRAKKATEQARKPPTSTASSPEDIATMKFSCQARQLRTFDVDDPFNAGNRLKGLICKKDGVHGGSLFLTSVNGKKPAPDCEVVIGVPKLQYPYANVEAHEFKTFPRSTASFVLAEKWNGMNVLFYKYRGPDGTVFVSAKSKGAPVIIDGPHGNFLTLTRRVLELPSDNASLTLDNLPPQLNELLKPEVAAISFELCGKLEPHLVGYDFDIDLKPLFAQMADTGAIRPILADGAAPVAFTQDAVVTACQAVQKEDLRRNEEYRAGRNLKIRYEHEHFACEGRVLYLLSENGLVEDRILMKIKPLDIEEVHFGTFDEMMRGRVKEVLRKIDLRGLDLCEETLKNELDMGPKEWNKFGKKVMAYVQILHAEADVNGLNMDDSSPVILVLSGPPGCGKSTFSKKLVELNPHWVRVNQDELKTAKRCEEAAQEALHKGHSVIIDRTNIDPQQRRRWINLARSLLLGRVYAIVFRIPLQICKDRVMTRQGHETLKPCEASLQVVERFFEGFFEPAQEEGFLEVVSSTEGSAEEVVQKFATLPTSLKPLDLDAIEATRKKSTLRAASSSSSSSSIVPLLSIPDTAEKPEALGMKKEVLGANGLPRFAGRRLGERAENLTARDVVSYGHSYIGVNGTTVDNAESAVCSQVPQACRDQHRRQTQGQPRHITLLTPSEVPAALQTVMLNASRSTKKEALDWLLDWLAINLRNDWTAQGLGRSSNTLGDCFPNSVFYVIVDWPSAALCRQALGLPQKHFHITLGYHFCDIHGVAKSRESLVNDAELQLLCSQFETLHNESSRLASDADRARSDVLLPFGKDDDSVNELLRATVSKLADPDTSDPAKQAWAALLSFAHPDTVRLIKEAGLQRQVGRRFSALTSAIKAREQAAQEHVPRVALMSASVTFKCGDTKALTRSLPTLCSATVGADVAGVELPHCSIEAPAITAVQPFLAQHHSVAFVVDTELEAASQQSIILALLDCFLHESLSWQEISNRCCFLGVPLAEVITADLAALTEQHRK